ncbi:MAG: hypothetical protein ACI901_002000, partial [Octadecabacter sp.]
KTSVDELHHNTKFEGLLDITEMIIV